MYSVHFVITICKLDQFDAKSSAKIGYRNEVQYYWGRVGRNTSYISWTGNGREGHMPQNDVHSHLFSMPISTQVKQTTKQNPKRRDSKTEAQTKGRKTEAQHMDRKTGARNMDR